jgi:hypothetical protein
MKTKLPKKLTDSEGYQDDPEETLKWWNEGFRPVRADQLKRGMEILYRQFMLFDSGGAMSVARLEDVAVEEYLVWVSSHEFGTADMDLETEVWVR